MSPDGDEFLNALRMRDQFVLGTFIQPPLQLPYNSDDRCASVISTTDVVLSKKEGFHLALFDFLGSQRIQWHAQCSQQFQASGTYPL